mmetsp:Transcript_8251/g.12508  ORF Transcript_8251/g.12508 Transcript_8251/m.12508 type:complete len:466 (-) Transcript_8251:144-1541(-)
MRKTAPLAAKARSLALNVHFKHPDLGMKEYEILSRATAFLLSVDPPMPSVDNTSPYNHLVKSQQAREDLLMKQDYSYDPAGGSPREAKDLGWLEFCPGTFRPLAHVVAASHVLSPWMWKNYYPQPWLEKITQDHVRYSVSVYDQEKKDVSKNHEPLATFGLNPYPIHHPNNMDLAVVHLKSEEGALKQMGALGVEMLHLADKEILFDKGDEVLFDGYEITADHYEAMEKMNDQFETRKETAESDDDARVFVPYNIKGNLIFASPDRFLAKTETPLPEGVCGGPVIDNNGNVCGVVEGIIPTDHEETELAGAASFIPYFRIKQFVDFAEREMLAKIVPKTLFDKVVALKDGKALHEKDKSHNIAGDQSLKEKDQGITMDRAYQEMVQSIRQTHSPEQVEAIIGTVEREQEEVLDMIEREGGDLDEIIAKVRTKTRERQREILKEMESTDIEDAQIVSDEQAATAPK